MIITADIFVNGKLASYSDTVKYGAGRYRDAKNNIDVLSIFMEDMKLHSMETFGMDEYEIINVRTESGTVLYEKVEKTESELEKEKAKKTEHIAVIDHNMDLMRDMD